MKKATKKTIKANPEHYIRLLLNRMDTLIDDAIDSINDMPKTNSHEYLHSYYMHKYERAQDFIRLLLELLEKDFKLFKKKFLEMEYKAKGERVDSLDFLQNTLIDEVNRVLSIIDNRDNKD